MNVEFKQDTRIGKLHTDLGKDVLVLLRFHGEDHVNDLFDYSIEALSTKSNIDFDALLGTHATVEMSTIKDGPRFFDGIVTSARWAGAGENGHLYHLTIRPWLWLAGKRRNQRIFHNQSAPEIIEAVLARYAGLGSPALSLRLTGSYAPLEYTVQYRESDLNFVCRMMERFGISYHFEHTGKNHTMVLTDTVDSHLAIPGGSRDYIGSDGHHQSEVEHFWEWSPARRLTTGGIRLTDWNFKKPDTMMELEHTAPFTYAESQLEAYDFPGDYLDPLAGKLVAKLRLDQERGGDQRHRALGDCASLSAGMTLALTGDQVPGVKDNRYLCLRASHNYVSQSYGSGGQRSDGYAYTGSFIMLPVAAPMVPDRKTPVPTVAGPQTAIVVGEGEIDCDEHGRILVHFPWDLDKAHSMRCRVSQSWAHKGWGGMVIPRIGMEVVVDFIEGNPDWPLVVGCVYNGKNDAPYKLPDHKTKSVFRSDTHQGDGFNEFTFEDQSGEEKIYLHAQRDHELHVENDRTKRVDRNQLESIGRNKTIEVGNNHHEVIGGNMTILVGPNKLQQFVTSKFQALTGKLGEMASNLGLPDFLNMGEGNLIVGVAKNKAETVMLSSTEVVGAGKAVTVGGGFQTVVGGIHNVTVGIGAYEEVGQNKATVVGKQYEIIVGDSKILIEENGTISLTGKTIIINGDDLVRITGKSVQIN